MAEDMATYKNVYRQTHPQTPKHVCKGKNEEIRRMEGTKYKIIAKSSTMTEQAFFLSKARPRGTLIIIAMIIKAAGKQREFDFPHSL